MRKCETLNFILKIILTYNRFPLLSNVQIILRLGYVDDYGTNIGQRRNLSDYITVI